MAEKSYRVQGNRCAICHAELLPTPSQQGKSFMPPFVPHRCWCPVHGEQVLDRVPPVDRISHWKPSKKEVHE